MKGPWGWVMSRGLTGGFFKQLEVVEQVERKREAASSIIHHSTAGVKMACGGPRGEGLLGASELFGWGVLV